MFPLAALLPLIELLRSHVMGVMRPLGDRTRRAPAMWRPEHRLIPEPLVVLIQAWLQKRRQLIEALMLRIAEGRHVGRAYRPREPKPGATPKSRAKIPPEKQLPPRVVGWINRMASEVNVYGVRLLHLACAPEMRAMIEGSPQMARLWVPLLNAMGQPRPDWWPKPPERPRRPRHAPPTRRPRRPRGAARPRNLNPSLPDYDPVAAWRARIPPPPPAPPLPEVTPSGTLGIGTSAPSIPPVPLPWWQERLWPPDHPIRHRPAPAAPAPQAAPAAQAAPAEERHWTERWVHLPTRRIREI